MAGITAEQGRAMLDSGDGADFMIQCKDRTWKVHKLLMSAVSEYFAQICKGNFKVSSHIECLERWPPIHSDVVYVV
jgi:hypothetical protein